MAFHHRQSLLLRFFLPGIIALFNIQLATAQYPPCNFCGALDCTVNNPDVFPAGQTQANCGQLIQFGLAGFIEPTLCTQLSSFQPVKDECGCNCPGGSAPTAPVATPTTPAPVATPTPPTAPVPAPTPPTPPTAPVPSPTMPSPPTVKVAKGNGTVKAPKGEKGTKAPKSAHRLRHIVV